MDPPGNHWSFCLQCCLKLDLFTLHFWVAWTRTFPFCWSQFALCFCPLQKKFFFSWPMRPGRLEAVSKYWWMSWLNGVRITCGRPHDWEWPEITLPPLQLPRAYCQVTCPSGVLCPSGASFMESSWGSQHRLSLLFVSLFFYFKGLFSFFFAIGDSIVIWWQLGN